MIRASRLTRGIVFLLVASLPAMVSAMPVNLAPGGTSSASSELNCCGGVFVSSRANDGNRAGNDNSLIFHTADPDMSAFYEIDLGSDFYLDRVQIFPRTNATQDSVENFRIDVFDSGGANVFTDNYQTAAGSSTRDKPWGTSCLALNGTGIIV